MKFSEPVQIGLDDHPASYLTFQSLAVSLLVTRFNIQKILHGARPVFSVLCGSHNRQRPLMYTSLTEWFL